MITVREFFTLHSILIAMVETELGCRLPSPEAVQEVLVRDNTEEPAPDTVLPWLALLDLAINTHLLRKHLKERGVDEQEIRAFLRFLASKKTHSQSDRDKVDWLATYLFQAREARTKQPTGWPKTELQSILEGIELPPPTMEAGAMLGEVSSLLEETTYFEEFPQITKSRIIQRGRELKNRMGEEFFHPDVLAAVINYNLIFGKKFNSLLNRTMQKVREFAAHVESDASDTGDLLQTDYRSTTDAFLHLSELEKKKETANAAAAAAPATLSPTGDPITSRPGGTINVAEKLKELGVNLARETHKLNERSEEITTLLRANPAMRSLPGGWDALPLNEWEASACRAEFAETEKSFRASVAQAVTHAIAILSLADDELFEYEKKKSTGFQWIKHSETLLYLLQEGRSHKERLMKISAEMEKKGLTEKAKQIVQTAERLEISLSKAAKIF